MEEGRKREVRSRGGRRGKRGDLLVLQEETLGLAGTLEVVVGSAPACTTPHSCTHLMTHITTLEGKRTACTLKNNRRKVLIHFVDAYI